jgi:Radial spoke protein 3
MEQMEQRKLQEFERKKALERERKKNKIAAHRKVCARTLAKSYMSNIQKCSFQYLKDVGYFVEPFQTNVLENNVLPWLYTKVESLVNEMQVQVDFSDVLVGSNVNHELSVHEKTVQAERDRKEAVKRSIEEAAQKKLEDKRKRKEQRELAKKAAGLKAMKEDLYAKFIAKGESKDSVLSQEFSEINGFYSKTNGVGAIGGFLGQMILVIAGAAKIAEKNKITDFFEPRVIQNFIFTFIETKLKTEKFTFMVGIEYEQFLNSLEKPLQLNEMRAMKESNYIKFRQLLSDPSKYGDEVLSLMAEHGDKLGLSKQAYDMVYEGFWDLYCKKPHATADIPVKKLEGFLSKVKLVIPPKDAADEEGNFI